ncbi:MAG: PKD domain-containing protein [Bacteroidales bacterium]
MKNKLQQFKVKAVIFLLVMVFSHPGISQTTLFTENWEAATIGQTPPPGWAVDLVSGANYTYFLQAGSFPTCTPFLGARMVEFKSFNALAGVSNRLKMTTPVSTAGFVAVSVDFEWLATPGYPGVSDNVAVQWSTNGTNWTTAATFARSNSANTWIYESILLPPAATNQPTLYVALQFTSAYGENCHLDLLHIKGYLTMPLPPTVTTLQPSWVGSQNAYLSATVNANGEQTNTYFQYGLTTAYGSTISSGSVTGNTLNYIYANPYPLIPGHLYHCRAVGTNVGGTIYGNDVTFTTSDTLPEVFTYSPSDITASGATLHGMVYPNGSNTSVTFDYGLTSGYGSTITATPAIVPGDSTHYAVGAVLTGLTPVTTYHCRIKGVNSYGTGYGMDTVFTTNGTVPAMVITNNATSITSTGATLNGHVNANGTPTDVTFQYGLTPAYGSTATVYTVYGNIMEPVSKPISGLLPGTLYHFRAVGVNANGTTYGADSVFTTNVLLPPTVTTNPSPMAGATYAIVSGTFNANGNQTLASFDYGLTTAYGLYNNYGNINGNTPITLNTAIYNLLPSHVYHFRAVGSNVGGTTYGNDLTFTTSDTLPAVFTYHATNIGLTTATLNGRVYPMGSATTISFNYGLTTSYGSSISATPSTIPGDSVTTWASANLTGLLPNTTYHYQIKGVNATGSSFGLDSIFTTTGALPTVITNGAYFATATNAGVSGFVNPNGSATTVSFQYGLTPAYGSVINSGTFNGNSMIYVNDQLFNLIPSTLYHFRIVGTNDGGTVYGHDTTFMTSDSLPCNAVMSYASTGPRTLQFHDNSTGGDHNSWWEFGDGNFSTEPNPLHTYATTGDYEVFLRIISNGIIYCYDSITQVVHVGDTVLPCHSQFTWAHDSLNSSIIHFTNLSTGNFTYYHWNFGDGSASTVANPTHNFAVPGNYNVCLTIYSQGCQDVSCMTVTVTGSPGHQIYGQVFADGIPIQTGVVNLFSVDTIAPYNPYLDISNIDTNGTYQFTMVPEGDYYVNAIPVGVPGYLPTFYGDVLFWEEASVIHLGTESNPYDIHLVNGAPSMPGSGGINGQINTSGLKTNYVEKISMLLMNSNGTAIRYGLVDNGGQFAFSSMAYGTYYLKAEMAGIASELIKVILSQENPNPSVTMTFTGSSVTGIQGSPAIINSWIVYPNPVTDHVTISLETKQELQIKLDIRKITGELLSARDAILIKGSNTVSMSTSELQAGIYILHLGSKDGADVYTKFIKTR